MKVKSSKNTKITTTTTTKTTNTKTKNNERAKMQSNLNKKSFEPKRQTAKKNVSSWDNNFNYLLSQSVRIFHRVGLHHHLSCTLCRLNNISVRNEPSNDLAHYRQPLCGSVLEHRNPKSEIPGFDYSRAVAQRWLHGPEAVLKNLNLRTDLSSQNQFKKYLDLEYKQDKKEVFLETGFRWPNDPRWRWTNKQ